MGRSIAIGDIHGGLKALIQLLEKIKITPDDELIFLGDYVDGWSDSANVVSYLIEFAKQNTCIFIRGNHDDLTHRWLESDELNEKWLEHGGQSSIDAYRSFSSEEIKAHIQFFKQMVNYYVDKKNRLFVHAGFTNQHGPEQEYHDTGFYWDRTLWEMALSLDKNIKPDDMNYPKRLRLFDEIFIGHTPVTRINEDVPVKRANIWNVDTGAAFMGKLSAIDVNSKEIWQSEPVFKLYPDEEGRN
ncbi:metallophosphatase [Salegentibacter salinarum]|uniref:Metallophosphatase n=1 Tax=Salegentibacter salinarum TaxID=447422 RepID=A0A2N0U3D4_9FLAO|nr:metallophosphoesterase family protein [Salegentibacter salinarum]PKD21520.1 metallophosphatase [Salegentibacter salinarum]SKB37261.1 serine/threonine protein phosphatase 1 [Salegentibacter salinarum]